MERLKCRFCCRVYWNIYNFGQSQCNDLFLFIYLLLGNLLIFQLHLSAGAKFVVVTAPSPDIPMFVMGVNHTSYKPSCQVVSNSCSTTQCLAPLAKLLHLNFEIVEGLMLTIHALTPTLNVVDSPGLGSKRESRGALQNIIPSISGAAMSIAQVLPELEGKLTGMAMKVPIHDVCVMDLTVCS